MCSYENERYFCTYFQNGSGRMVLYERNIGVSLVTAVLCNCTNSQQSALRVLCCCKRTSRMGQNSVSFISVTLLFGSRYANHHKTNNKNVYLRWEGGINMRGNLREGTREKCLRFTRPHGETNPLLDAGFAHREG